MTPQLRLGQGFEVTPGFFRQQGCREDGDSSSQVTRLPVWIHLLHYLVPRMFMLWLRALSEGRLVVFVQLPASLL